MYLSHGWGRADNPLPPEGNAKKLSNQRTGANRGKPNGLTPVRSINLMWTFKALPPRPWSRVTSCLMAVILLPADYCQLELPIAVQRRLTELVWKSDIWFGDKGLGLKETVIDVIHYCQLGKLAVVTDARWFTHGRRERG